MRNIIEPKATHKTPHYPKGQRVGYVRVSTLDQNEHRQLEGFELDKVFLDRASEKDVKRPQLIAMPEFVREGDSVSVTIWIAWAGTWETCENWSTL